jgi:multidrug efflux pump subunit AcrB
LASLVIALTLNPSLAVMFSGKDSKFSENDEKQKKSTFKKALDS